LRCAGAPLPRASVLAERLGVTPTAVQISGRYEIRVISVRTYTVQRAALGYVPQSARVTVGRTRPQDFVLAEQRSACPAGDVVVGSATQAAHARPSSSQSARRRVHGGEIARRGTNETSQILQEPGASVIRAQSRHGRPNDIVRPSRLRGLSPSHARAS